MAATAVSFKPSQGGFCFLGPADVYVPNWAAAGVDAGLDITIRSPLQQATVDEVATTPWAKPQLHWLMR